MDKFSYYLVFTLTTALFVGCESLPSIGPDYVKPEYEAVDTTLPDAGATTKDDLRIEVTPNELTEWWKHFNDPVLNEIVDCAVTNNRAFLMAQERYEQRRFELFGSYAAFMPHFGLGGSWTRQWMRENASSVGQSMDYNTQQVGLDGNWEIDVFGGNRRRTEAAMALLDAADCSCADVWVVFTTQIGIQYVNLRTVQARIAVERTNLALQEETYEILKSRLDSGIGDELAVNQCAYIVEQTRSNIPELLHQEEQLKNALAVLAGKVPGDYAEKLAPLEESRDWLLAPQKVSELPLDLVRGRPDVMAAERTLAARTAMIGVAKAQWFPKLHVTGQVGFRSTDNTRLFDSDSFFASLGPSVSWPILQGGLVYANIQIAESQMREAALGYEHALETAYGEVRDSYSRYTQEYHRYEALQSAVRAASDAVTISRDLYKNGLRDFNNVLDAQRSRLQLEEAYVISRGQITVNLINLYKSLGGGVPTPKAEEPPAETEEETAE